MDALRRLAPFIAPYRGRAAWALAFLLLAAAAALAIPVLLRQAIDQGFREVLARGDTGALAATLGALAAGAAVASIASAARFVVVSWLGERVVADLRTAVWSNVLAQPPRFFETLKTGEVLSRLTADTTLIQTLVGSSLSMGLRSAVMLAGSVAMMAVTAPRLTGAVLASMGAVVAVTMTFSRRVRRLSRQNQDRIADLAGSAGEVLGAIATVQVSGQEPAERRRFAERVEVAFAAGMRRTRLRAALIVVVMLAFTGGLLWGAWTGGQAVMAGTTTVGTLAQYLFYAVMAGGAASVLSEVWGDLQRAAGASERLIELLDAKPQIADPAEPLAPPAAAPAGGIEVRFAQVAFAYPARPGHPVLRDFSLRAAAGERVAIVGRSGAGKSTLFALLQRFHDLDAGCIELGGVPADAMRLADLRRLIAVVPQEPAIFSGDAWHNIRYGRPDATDDEVRAAAHAAHADEFLATLPEGYATELGERGVRLSGGQKQRIAIARALLRDAPLLLLDEATSALDAESERAVQDALATAMRGRTTLVIAHRLATIRDADRVVLLEHGQVVETGTHDELLAHQGLYWRLSHLQSLAA